jgi:hypothetical protein
MIYVSKRGIYRKSIHVSVKKYEVRKYTGEVRLAGTRIVCFSTIYNFSFCQDYVFMLCMIPTIDIDFPELIKMKT